MGRAGLTALGCLYVAQGVPVYFFTVGVASILREEGLGLEWIGMLPLLALPWVFKFLWAPMLDRLGRRVFLITTLQLVTALLIFGLSFFRLSDELLTFFLLGLAIAFVSSTQDVVVDAFAIERFPQSQRAYVNALQASGAALGSVLGGTLLLVLYSQFGWEAAARILATVVAVAVIPFLMASRLAGSRGENVRPAERASRERPSLRRAFKSSSIVTLVLLALATRFCEGLVMAMQQPVLIDHGVDLETIGVIVGSVGAGVGMVAAWISSQLQKRQGEDRAYFMALNLRSAIYLGLFLTVILGAANPSLLMGLVLANMATRFLVFVPLYSLYMRGSSLTQSGTDFAVLMGADYLFYFLGAACSGFVAANLGYGTLFGFALALSLAGTFWATRLLKNEKGDARLSLLSSLQECP